ncbi:prenylated protein [Cyclospora cayetanensis]|uniref:Prenylated protein n=1 Tax=Cyclospora cayetanensis TaxID=88456 RepID=A0A1D3D410_9EIME|nr:prenylated protein [Cyclospora cayetanensis]
MKLIALLVCRCSGGLDNLVFLSGAYDLSGYPFYQRNAVKEGIKFIARTAIPRLPVGRQQEVEHEGSVAFVFRYPDSLAILAIGDHEYPRRIVFACLNEVHEEFTSSFSRLDWPRIEGRSAASKSSKSNHPDIPFQETLADILKKYKDPLRADELLRVQQKANFAQACQPQMPLRSL